jgi:hypothetical protein
MLVQCIVYQVHQRHRNDLNPQSLSAVRQNIVVPTGHSCFGTPVGEKEKCHFSSTVLVALGACPQR